VYLKNKFTISHAWIVVLLLAYAQNFVFVCVCVRELITVTTEALMLPFRRAIHHKIEINTSFQLRLNLTHHFVFHAT